MNEEFKRIYTDAVEDAYAKGVEEGNKNSDRGGMVQQVEVIRRELKNMYAMIEESWKDGYESSREDSFHGTRTKFKDTEWGQKCMKSVQQ
jgi:hypothetical protein